MKVLLTHPGTQYAPRLAAALYEQGVLYKFATGIAFADDKSTSWYRLARMLGKAGLWQKRVIPGLPKGYLHLQPAKELWALFRHQALKQGNDAVFFPRNRAFQQQVPEKLLRQADAVIGFDTSSWILADRCRQLGKPFILDVSIAHPLAKEKAFATLRQQYPQWAAELSPKQPHLIEAELREMELATHLVVASSFTRQTYLDYGVPAPKITVNPYGTHLRRSNPLAAGGRVDAPFTFLFFGALSARKGFPWLCALWPELRRQFPQARLLAAGYDFRPPGFAVPEGIEVVGAVHPAGREALFARADAFVFPSFFEGFGQVLLEAMVCGLPIITTTATAGADLLAAHPDAGILINPGNDAALLQAMAALLQDSAAGLRHRAQHAQQAAAAFTWQAYGKRWKEVVGGVMR
jgi:glycosyltransferase involved in cell wall biosynthesis